LLDGAAPARQATSGIGGLAATAGIAPVSVAFATTAATKTVGYGRRAVGGAGGTRRVVRNLRDSGPGSLRAALEGRGRRVVLFRVGGTIRLSSPIRIKYPYITVRGGTAPSPGITVRGDGISVVTHDVILHHLRLRPGDRTENPSETDALTINGAGKPVYNVVVDHLSMVWGPDIGGLAILGDVSHVTIQNSIMGEGLYLSAHPEGTRAHGGHSTAANVTPMQSGGAAPRNLTFWHNLFTTSDERMPRLQAARCVDVVNNVMFNWGTKAAAGNPRSLNLVGNWFRRGPRTERREIWHSQTSGVAPTLFRDSIYQAGNAADGFAFRRGGAPRVFAATARCGGLSVRRQPASEARAAVMAGAGAVLPVRDSVDRRVIANVRNRVGRYFNGAGYPAPNPYWP
jgi:pectate lyase